MTCPGCGAPDDQGCRKNCPELPKSSKWGMSDALHIVRTIQPKLHSQGWHVAMGGGVLNTGASEKDLDLYFIPFDSSCTQPDILPILKSWWGMAIPLSKIRDDYPDDTNFAHKVKFFLEGGKRIDAFVMPQVIVTEF